MKRRKELIKHLYIIWIVLCTTQQIHWATQEENYTIFSFTWGLILVVIPYVLYKIHKGDHE